MRLKEQEMNEKESAYRAVQEANDTVRAQAKEYEAKCEEYVTRIQAMEEQHTNKKNENTQDIKRYEERIDGLSKEIQGKIDEMETLKIAAEKAIEIEKSLKSELETKTNAMRLKEQEMNEKESAYRAVQEANDTVRAQAKEYEAKCEEYVTRIQAMEEQNTNKKNEN
eukprot:944885_1